MLKERLKTQENQDFIEDLKMIKRQLFWKETVAERAKIIQFESLYLQKELSKWDFPITTPFELDHVNLKTKKDVNLVRGFTYDCMRICFMIFRSKVITKELIEKTYWITMARF